MARPVRRLFVVGRRPPPQAAEALAGSLDKDVETVLLSLGYPISPAQARLVEETVRTATAREAPLDAILVPSTGALAGWIRPGDDVVVLAEGRAVARVRTAVEELRGERFARFSRTASATAPGAR